MNKYETVRDILSAFDNEEGKELEPWDPDYFGSPSFLKGRDDFMKIKVYDNFFFSPQLLITDRLDHVYEYIRSRHNSDAFSHGVCENLIVFYINKHDGNRIKYTNAPTLEGCDAFYIFDNLQPKITYGGTGEVFYDQNGDFAGHDYGIESVELPDYEMLKVNYCTLDFIGEKENCFLKLFGSSLEEPDECNICLDILDEVLLYRLSYVLSRNHDAYCLSLDVPYQALLDAFFHSSSMLADATGGNITKKDEKRIKRLDLEKIRKFDYGQIRRLTSDYDRNYIELTLRQGKSIEEQEEIFDCIKRSYEMLAKAGDILYDNKIESILDDVFIDIQAGSFLCVKTNRAELPDEPDKKEKSNSQFNRKQAIFLLHHSGITKPKKLTQLQYGAVIEMLAGHSHNTVKRDFNKFMKSSDLTEEEATMVIKEYNRLSNDNGKKKKKE